MVGRRLESPRTDFVSSMLAAERGGTQFTDEEILGNLIQIIPGPDVLTMLISNAVLALLRHPDQLALLKKDPALIGRAIEECLRYDSMILGFARVATEDVKVRGQLIHKGQTVFHYPKEDRRVNAAPSAIETGTILRRVAPML